MWHQCDDRVVLLCYPPWFLYFKLEINITSKLNNQTCTSWVEWIVNTFTTMSHVTKAKKTLIRYICLFTCHSYTEESYPLTCIRDGPIRYVCLWAKSLTTLGLIYKTSYDKYATMLRHAECLRQMYDTTISISILPHPFLTKYRLWSCVNVTIFNDCLHSLTDEQPERAFIISRS